MAVIDADGEFDRDCVAELVTERLTDVDGVLLSVIVRLPDGVLVIENEMVSDGVLEIDCVGGKDLVPEVEMVKDEVAVRLALVDGVSGCDDVEDAVALGDGESLTVGRGVSEPV